MKEHEDEVMSSADKSTVAAESTGVDKAASEISGDGGGKSLGFLTEKDQDEDVMVDVVGSDTVEDDVHRRTGANLDGNSVSEDMVMHKETETRDQVMEDVAGSGEDCDASGKIRVLNSEKAEVVVNEEEVAGSGEDCNASVETRVLTTETIEVIMNEGKSDRSDEVRKDVAIPVASGSNGDIAVTDDFQETIDRDCAVDEKIEKENEELITTVEGEISVHAENLDQQAEVDNLFENKEIMQQPKRVKEVVYGNGVMGEKTGKEDEILDSSKIPESLTTVEDPVLSCADADMDKGDDAVIDVDKDHRSSITANSEANVEQKLPESSSKPAVTQYREEHIKSREPIVYGRRVHVEVPLYEPRDVEQKLPEPSSPVSEDEALKIETDSDSDDGDGDGDDNDDDDVQDKQNSELHENKIIVPLHQPRYFKPPKNEGEFAVSDLVWGKVRSHPWWPGQIIDPSNASKKAMKYYKKDAFLVAYFGDHSFAWNNPSVLKPFRANFSQNEKQINTEIFKTAVDCALEEVSRRVELGLACSCVPKEIVKEIEYQEIENAGVAKKFYIRLEKDESASVSSFEPDKLVDYVRLLAQFPAQCDKMDVAITKAQLSSYGRYKGYRELPEFLICGDIAENDLVDENVEKVDKNGEKFENDSIEIANPNKEISLSDVTDDAPESVGGSSKRVSSSGVKKRKARVSISNGSVKRPNRPPTKVAPTPAPVSTPKPSFKVGALIQRVASQLTGPVVKSGSDPKVEYGQHGQHADQIVQTSENPQMESSVAEMLSQLCLTAQDPMKEYGFFQTIIPFFYERRAAVFSKSLKKTTATVEKPDSDTKKKESNENEPEEFEFDFDFDFDDVNDSYWTDRIVQNHSEDQPMEETQNGAVEEYPVVEHVPDKPGRRGRRADVEGSQVIDRDHEPEPQPQPEVEEESEVDRKRRENLATEILLKFEEGVNFCSETQLNKMFKRFGPLMESETEVDRDGGRARVVFKKCLDAEVAHNSAGRFNIFGSVNVSYELNYSPLVSYKPLPLSLLQEDHMDAS